MTPLVFVAVAVAGGVGAGLRYVVDAVVRRVLGSRFPWGILTVNLTGAFALGILSAGLVDATGLWVLGAGLLGGYTTFSSVAVTTVLLGEDGRAPAAVAYGVGTLAASIVAAVSGIGLGMLLS